MASTDAGDWEGATEWCELVDTFAREHGTTPLLGACRTVHADVLLATGRWADAEQALEDALQMHARYVPAMSAPTLAAMAVLRVRQGRIPEAEQLLAGREEHPGSLRALAHLRIAQGQPHVASVLLERGLLGAAGDAVRTIQLLAPLVDARLACGELDAAQATAARLADLAASTGIALARGRADLAAARVAIAAGRTSDAADAARSALAEFWRLAMPLDSGEARLELARAIAGEAPDVALEEARECPTRESPERCSSASGPPATTSDASSPSSRDVLEITAFERPGDWGEHFKSYYGPTIAARKNAVKNGLEADFDAAMTAFCDEWGSGESPARFEQEYLLSVGTRR